MERDLAVATGAPRIANRLLRRSRDFAEVQRLADGTLVVAEPTFDCISGHVNTSRYWSGLSGHGRKSAWIRLYIATELIQLLQSPGLRLLSAHRGWWLETFQSEGPELRGRFGILT